MITAIPRCLSEYETKGENSWNFPPHPAHPGLVPCEEIPLKSSCWNSLLKSKVIHWDRGVTESKSDNKKCKKGDSSVIVQIFQFSFQVSSSSHRMRCQRFPAERWVNLLLLCGNSWSREEKAALGWNSGIIKHTAPPLSLASFHLCCLHSPENWDFQRPGHKTNFFLKLRDAWKRLPAAFSRGEWFSLIKHLKLGFPPGFCA